MTRTGWTSWTCLVICLSWQLTCSSSMYSGSWCPYQEERLVPCRVRNGTEPYYGPNICWKSVNGSYACTKKILHRPKFITTYKKMFETKYKCCPGLEGENCEMECFNCSSYNKLLTRLEKLEQLTGNSEQPFDHEDDSLSLNELHNDYLSSKDELLERNRALTFLGLDTRISSLVNENRALESRVRRLESEVLRLTNSLEDLSKLVNQFSSTHHHQNHPQQEDPPGKLLTTHQPSPLRKPNYSHQSPEGSNTSSASFPHTTTLQSPWSPFTSSKSESFPPPPTRTISSNNKSTLRRFEDNLERGDIASTLNDDYDEELLFDNSTEQYVDPLLTPS